jgi:hypothetical protein
MELQEPLLHSKSAPAANLQPHPIPTILLLPICWKHMILFFNKIWISTPINTDASLYTKIQILGAHLIGKAKTIILKIFINEFSSYNINPLYFLPN